MKTKYRHCKECNKLHNVAEWPHADEAATEGAAYIPGQNYDEYLMGPKSGTFRKCRACGDLHDICNWPDNHFEEPPPRSELAAPAFISDNLESLGGLNGIQNQADGRFYTSKAKLRADYRARNMLEVGNDPQRHKAFQKPRPDRAKIKEAIHRATYAVMNEGARVENFVRQRKPSQNTAFGRVAPRKGA